MVHVPVQGLIRLGKRVAVIAATAAIPILASKIVETSRKMKKEAERARTRRRHGL